ncbi:hypothetical protein ACIPSE_25980 [Streptomyces sp. NPDC090106]|uniref:F0F1 ATP synthase subunit B family protein n=1 Tax=Streptomyces sp. NPDC090106 TaxID=3365946 RepID=UPI0038044C05
MRLIPLDIGPMNPQVEDLVYSLALFTVCFLCVVSMLRRVNRVLAERERATDGAARQAEEIRARALEERAKARDVLAEGRHEAARIRSRAEAEGAVLIADARAEGVRERDALLAEAATRLESDLAAARTELQRDLPHLAAALAGRVLGEPVGPGARAS